MKKLIVIACLWAICAVGASAQKYALIDMEYILKNIPAYEMANEQLNQVAKRWQKECEDLAAEAETLYKNYQSDLVFLTDEMKTQRADEVQAKEQEVVELRKRYFGPEGELYKKTRKPHEAHSGRNIQRGEENCRGTQLHDDYRPRLVGEHYFCVT